MNKIILYAVIVAVTYIGNKVSNNSCSCNNVTL